MASFFLVTMASTGIPQFTKFHLSPADRLSLRRYQGYAAALEQAGISITPAYTVGPPVAPAFATQEDGN
jgi:hypothetical protein